MCCVCECPPLCNPMDCSPPGVHGILQARILEWVAIPFSRGSSQPRNRIWVSHIAGRPFYHLSHQGNPGFTGLYAKPTLMEAVRFFPLHLSCLSGTCPLLDSFLSSLQGGANWKSCCSPLLITACSASARFSLCYFTVIWGWSCHQGPQWGYISLFGNLSPPCPSRTVSVMPLTLGMRVHANCPCVSSCWLPCFVCLLRGPVDMCCLF